MVTRSLALVTAVVCVTVAAATSSCDGDAYVGSPRATGQTTASALSTSPSTSGRTFTIVATGDVLLHPPLWAQARRDAVRSGSATMDFAPMLAGVKPYVSAADLALCHLETPLAGTAGPFSGYPSFSGPPQITSALKAVGYDACSTASNHTFDQGAAGVKRTLDTLDAAGIAHAGSARTRTEWRRITMVQANGVTFTRGNDGRFTATAAEYVPLLMTKTAPLRVLDVQRALQTGSYGSTTQSRLRAALARTTKVVQSIGGAKHGLRAAAPPP